MVDIAKQLPKFQIITHPRTGRRTGRIYFPQLYIAHNKEELINWLKQSQIYFTQSDAKLYGDGSFSLRFEAPQR